MTVRSEVKLQAEKGLIDLVEKNQGYLQGSLIPDGFNCAWLDVDSVNYILLFVNSYYFLDNEVSFSGFYNYAFTDVRTRERMPVQGTFGKERRRTYYSSYIRINNRTGMLIDEAAQKRYELFSQQLAPSGNSYLYRRRDYDMFYNIDAGIHDAFRKVITKSFWDLRISRMRF